MYASFVFIQKLANMVENMIICTTEILFKRKEEKINDNITKLPSMYIRIYI